MANKGDLIDFDIIETQKENIQSLPSGRSAKSLAQIFSPLASVAPPSHTQNLNDAIRAEYEKELITIDESDDPLDIYDRYVRWTLNAYPSAQATSASQLLPLLERATKSFLKFDHYKNDPRYLKLWLHYVRFFSDAPRETFAYLARHGIGEGLALFYEEFAAWLEGAGRWNQAEEIYRMGIERGARPTERLARKFANFEKRLQRRDQSETEPTSPALPTVRPALAAKIDPFSTNTPTVVDPQAASRATTGAGTKRQKMQVFADDGVNGTEGDEISAGGWESIGTIADRKKENTIAATPWVGETLNRGSRQNFGVPKMPIFKDVSPPKLSAQESSVLHTLREQQVVNPRTGKVERVFVNLEAVYPDPSDPSQEYCFEELRASARGWLQRDWIAERAKLLKTEPKIYSSDATTVLVSLPPTCDNYQDLADQMHQGLVINDENLPPDIIQKCDVDIARRIRREEKANKTRKIRVREVKGETQTIQTNLASPKGPKLRRKKSAEPTMTVHTKVATDEIYELFSRPLKSNEQPEEEEESDEDSDDDEDYTSAGESTGTGRISGATSEYDDDTRADLADVKDLVEEVQEVTENDSAISESTTNGLDASDNESEDRRDHSLEFRNTQNDDVQRQTDVDELPGEQLITPTSPGFVVAKSEPRHIPITADPYEAPTRPYRSAAQAAHSRMPFMTPIVEKTESSLGTVTTRQEKDYFNSKTPCPKTSRKTPTIPEIEDEVWSSPFQEVLNGPIIETAKPPPPMLLKARPKEPAPTIIAHKSRVSKESLRQVPVIEEAQCNPMEDSVHRAILSSLQPPMSTFDGYFEHRDSIYNRKVEIKKFCKTVANSKSSRSGNDKTASTLLLPPILRFEGAQRQYAIKRELGAGAYAPVYLIEHIDTAATDEEDDHDGHAVMGKGRFGTIRHSLEAMKMEEPPSPWEFYIIRIAHRRLGVSRAVESIIQAYEMHLFKDEGYLIEEYHDQGTLLDLVNGIMQQTNNGSAMDETLAMFFTIELLRTVEALHAKGIIHGDLKADNVLVRFPPGEEDVSTNYCADGTNGWSSKGLKLIDFGRGIDMRAFRPDVQFIADWPTSATDCAEMRELRPWTFQADYHGVAAIAHTMLFGRYIETTVDKGAGAGIAAGKTYRLKEGLKRYWQGELWGDLFALMLNPARQVSVEEGQKMPCVRGMRAVREKMEAWLVGNGEKGVGLRALVRKVEMLAGPRRKL